MGSFKATSIRIREAKGGIEVCVWGIEIEVCGSPRLFGLPAGGGHVVYNTDWTE